MTPDPTRPHVPTTDPPADRTGDYLSGTEPDATAPDGAPAVPGYVVTALIARGGMGAVYAARELALDREVAIKTLLPGADPARFLTESRVTAKLPHPNVPPVYALGTLATGAPFLAMKLVRGRTLAELLAARTSPRDDWPRLLAAFEQVCQAVGFAHSRGVIHRDLKPANVMVGEFGEVQVMDWGLAREARGPDPESAGEAVPLADTAEPVEYTRAGAVMGTPAYMAPEQARGESVDARADLFALGAVLLEVLAGVRPWGKGATFDVVRRAATGDTAAARAALAACGADAELRGIAERCLRGNPAERYASASELATAVAEYRQNVEARLRAAEAARAAATTKAAEERKRRKVQFALAAAVLLLAGAGAGGVVLASLWRTSEANRIEAEAQREAADSAKADAEKQRTVADGLRAEAEAARERATVLEHCRAMQVAQQEWTANYVGRARGVLNDARRDLSGWETSYLRRLCHADLLTIRCPGKMVLSAQFSPDGARVLTAGYDNRAHVWDATTGAEVLVVTESAPVLRAAYGPDGASIITAAFEGPVRVWDAKTGKPLRTLVERVDRFASVLFGEEGRYVVTTSNQGRVTVYDSAGGLPKADAVRGGDARALAISPDGARVALVPKGGDAYLTNTARWNDPLALKGHAAPVSALFARDGARVLTTGIDRTARLWDAKTGAALGTLTGHINTVRAGAFSADGALVATAGADWRAGLWDARNGTLQQMLKGHTEPLTAIEFSPDGTRVVTAAEDGTARVWSVRARAEGLILAGHADTVFRARYSPDGSRIVTVSPDMDKSARIWDGETGELLHTLPHPDGGIADAAFSADGKVLHTLAFSPSRARKWDANTGAELPPAGPFPRARSRDGALLVAGGHAIDTATGARLYQLGGACVALSDDGARVVVADNPLDRIARVRAARTGEVLSTLKGHTELILSVALNADGTRAVTGSADRTARVWDTRTGAELFVLKGHTAAVQAVAFSPDGSRIVTGGSDGQVKLWDLRTGLDVLTLSHGGTVYSVEFHPDGTRILTGSRDRTARVWDARPLNREFVKVK